jgi:hypothetical protein
MSWAILGPDRIAIGSLIGRGFIMIALAND